VAIIVSVNGTHAQVKTLQDQEIGIDSYPHGAEVYLFEGSEVPDEQSGVESITKYWKFIGRTPICARLNPGDYIIAVVANSEQLNHSGINMSNDGALDYLPSSGQYMGAWRNSITTDKIANTTFEETKFALLYHVQKKEGEPSILISLFLPTSIKVASLPRPFIYLSLDSVESLPDSYSFDNDFVRNTLDKDLKEYGIILSGVSSEDLVQIMHKVGMVRVQLPDKYIMWREFNRPEGNSITTTTNI
jgi:hypothetical protein